MLVGSYFCLTVRFSSLAHILLADDGFSSLVYIFVWKRILISSSCLPWLRWFSSVVHTFLSSRWVLLVDSYFSWLTMDSPLGHTSLAWLRFSSLVYTSGWQWILFDESYFYRPCWFILLLVDVDLLVDSSSCSKFIPLLPSLFLYISPSFSIEFWVSVLSSSWRTLFTFSLIGSTCSLWD